MAKSDFTTMKAAKAKHGRGKVVRSSEDQELKNTLTIMLNSLRVTAFLLFHETQKLKSGSLTIEGQREFAKTLGLSLTDKGEIIFNELDPGDREHMALLRGRLRQWLQAHEERAQLREDQLH